MHRDDRKALKRDITGAIIAGMVISWGIFLVGGALLALILS